ncbi:DEAD/DEAH box helicase family protein [Alteriqipengyuania flavescens]|uniref:DEAD/DEAH box helicase n=1 Tax=Alteriqipengyuania flavescens TaxID=3053610 RepID=UPI0025B2C4F6|nr:type ISP restriction/modification enzyme [Alteriqipengyuania flavescens]WJY19830.1 DEAD/DEAH box helicase family protein [Alteriqipengyuania flavescens]WJY25772.1 DEAD/DEAH box helicase family protein [Alteriqipengyuania flavescens]
MASALRKLLDQYRDVAQTEREKGTYFERLALVFLKNDPGMKQEYEDAWEYGTWAANHGLSKTDNGIDVVAKIRGEDSFCAIQCKFYREGGNIPKAEVDKFLSTLGAMGRHFSRGLIIETTGRPFSANATALFDDLNVTTIGLDRLEESTINWEAYFVDGEIKVDPPKKLRQHQEEALRDVKAGLAEADRGKLIMACGTGKTFTGLKIAEDMVGAGGNVLVLLPSLALVNQTIREWTIDSQTPLRSFAVCSDAQVGKRKKGGQDDVAEVELHDLDYPVTTNAANLASRSSYDASDRMTVVFSTYQSIQVISEAQKLHSLPEFDLIICDEAHRTTGATLAGEDESNFVKVHNQDYIAARKRLYMTATPRVFGEAVKAKASEASAELASMDDEALYGETLFTRGFGWAVENQLLTDYKVIVLAVDEEMVSASVQNRLKDADSSLVLDDATKIIGCYKALIKSGLAEEVQTDPQPMQRALAFCKDIASSKLIQTEFRNVIEEYLASDEGQEALGDATLLTTELQHVDGTMGAKERANKLDWLKETHGDAICRILSNARCMSEGVDVPALDAILFMHPRKSQIDVVQSVGRVMRRAPGKNMGYVILPIGVPAGMTPEEALADNERYRVVWQILNALRSHDERFDAQLNQADLGVDISHKIEVVAVSNKLSTRSTAKPKTGIGDGSGGGEDDTNDGDSKPKADNPFQTGFVFDEFSRAIMAKIVKKCGRRDYWENWAGDIAKIAETHISRIKGIISREGSPERKAFDAFLAEIRDDLNPEVSEEEAIEMLAQHLITRPVFDALFESYDFAANNPVSRSMQGVLKALDEHRLDKEAESLDRFYASVQRRAQGIDNAEAKQKIVVELYDKFFRNAFPRMTERLGIVYTPVEVVDFIIHSVNEVLQSEFGQTLGSKGVHILDPFTGTGTFITRLLQSGLIKPEELEHKYKHEIHANEIVLLAYYIAAINIEAVYHSQSGGDYAPFEGICLTDTFQMGEQQADLLAEIFPVNSDRRTRQMELPVRVIVGNPPYSIGQGSANDNAGNASYQKLDDKIEATYVARSNATLSRGLYDSYVRAIRWASDRIGDAGVVGYISGSGFAEKPAMDGLRKTLAEEFLSIHVLNLRGDIRKNMLSKGRAKEGQNVFGSGSMTGNAITIFVKNPSGAECGQIYYHDIGDDLSTEEKLKRIARFRSIEGIRQARQWEQITPDEHGDWLGQRDRSFDAFIRIGDKKGGDPAIFENFSLGVVSNRDSWAYNFSRDALSANMGAMIGCYNREVERFDAAHPNLDRKSRGDATDDFVENDPTKISWTRGLKGELAKGKLFAFDDAALTLSLYRPFTSQWQYYDRTFNEMVLQMPRIFPLQTVAKNRVIQAAGIGARSGFSALMSNSIPALDTIEKGQCYPRFLYDEQAQESEDDLFANGGEAGLKRRDALTDEGVAHFQAAYPGETITKDDLFYYVYGLLHSEGYRSRFSDNLSKELPRIPAVKKAVDFWAFTEAGRTLGDLHCDYETAEPFPVTFAQGALELAHIPDPKKFFRVEKMKFHKVRNKDGKLEPDKTTVIYNSNITITGIPLEAYDYVVNGKAALDWVMERQCVKTDAKSGIVNDANRYAIETVGDPAYPLKLFQRVITVSLETMKIVRNLPKLEID